MTLKFINAVTAKNRCEALLAEADQARDDGRWSEAAEHYAEYLKVRGNDSPIWVQYGHSLKESGNLAEAEAAYRQSLMLCPEVSDTHLQLGHLCKLRRDYSGAISAYKEALRALTGGHSTLVMSWRVWEFPPTRISS